VSALVAANRSPVRLSFGLVLVHPHAPSRDPAVLHRFDPERYSGKGDSTGEITREPVSSSCEQRWPNLGAMVLPAHSPLGVDLLGVRRTVVDDHKPLLGPISALPEERENRRPGLSGAPSLLKAEELLGRGRHAARLIGHSVRCLGHRESASRHVRCLVGASPGCVPEPPRHGSHEECRERGADRSGRRSVHHRSLAGEHGVSRVGADAGGGQERSEAATRSKGGEGDRIPGTASSPPERPALFISGTKVQQFFSQRVLGR